MHLVFAAGRELLGHSFRTAEAKKNEKRRARATESNLTYEKMPRSARHTLALNDRKSTRVCERVGAFMHTIQSIYERVML